VYRTGGVKVGKKIMVVDDSRHIVNAVKKVLESENFEVVPAYGGEECLSKLKKEKPDLILLDILMPTSGIEVLRVINPPSSQTKVAMLSVMGQEQVVRECKRLGAVDHITKPFDNEDLVRRVKSLLNE
jgi:DNA-binding response OmpR family regulator